MKERACKWGGCNGVSINGACCNRCGHFWPITAKPTPVSAPGDTNIPTQKDNTP